MDLEERQFAAITALYDLSRRGTLWRVLNTLWKRAIPGFVEKRNKKGGVGCHAGLALGKKTVNCITDIFPMCIGTSRKHGKSIRVSDVFPSSAKKTTYFAIKPVRVQIKDFFIDGERQISPMPGKAALTDGELKEFESALARNGLHI